MKERGKGIIEECVIQVGVGLWLTAAISRRIHRYKLPSGAAQNFRRRIGGKYSFWRLPCVRNFVLYVNETNSISGFCTLSNGEHCRTILSSPMCRHANRCRAIPLYLGQYLGRFSVCILHTYLPGTSRMNYMSYRDFHGLKNIIRTYKRKYGRVLQRTWHDASFGEEQKVTQTNRGYSFTETRRMDTLCMKYEQTSQKLSLPTGKSRLAPIRRNVGFPIREVSYTQNLTDPLNTHRSKQKAF